MTPRNNMGTADPQAADALEATSARNTFEGEAVSSRPTSSTQRSRRYTRIAASLPIVVRDQFGGREETRTLFVMIRGAVLATTSNLRVGHKLTLQIARTGRAAECHVVGIDSGVKDGQSVEVEFTREQQDFWPIQFPPEDLKTDSGSYRFAAAPTSTIGSHTSTVSDTLKHATTEPLMSNRSGNELVSLADSISGDSFTSPSVTKQEKFTPRSAPVDSVAQFRAANRAAHRREQRTKALYSFLSIAALAVVLLGVRYWMQHRSEMEQVKLPEVSLPSISHVLPKAKAPEKHVVSSSNDQIPPTSVVTPTRPAPAPANTPFVTSAPAVVDPVSPPVEESVPSSAAPEIKLIDTQVTVRHGASPKPAPQPAEDVGEEPLALPLRVDSGTSVAKPQVLNEVVAQTPMKAALLAPQPARKAVPARLIYSAPAQYPPMARQIRAEGEVVISLDVDASGNVSTARAVSGPPILRAAALDAVKRWKYQPATLGDRPVVSTEVVKVQFRLK